MARRLLAAAWAILFGLSAVPTAAVAAPDPRQDVLILFTSPPTSADLALVHGMGGRVSREFTIVPAVAASLPARAIDALRANPRVAVVEPDGLLHALEYRSTHDWGVAHVRADEVHGTGTTGAGVRVAVIDSGIDCDHVELVKCEHGWNYVSNTQDADDDYGHGTHVAGSIAASLDGTTGGAVGVAPGATVVAYKTLDSGGVGSWSRHIDAIEDIWNGGAPTAQVVNMSIGRGDYSETAEAAMEKAYAAGILLVAAAGNSGICAGKGTNIAYPALFSSVIAVGAIDSANARPCWSSTGSKLELTAPGVSVYSTWPANMSTSYRDPQPVCEDLHADGSPECHYKYGSGTSMSSPHVAGVAALVLSADLLDTNVLTDADLRYGVANELRDRLAATAVDLGPTGRDTLYGFGLVNAAAALSVSDGGGGTGGITLEATKRKTRNQYHVDLAWTDTTGASATDVDVYRDGSWLAKTPNDGAYTDSLGRTYASHQYQVCHAGTSTCSNVVASP